MVAPQKRALSLQLFIHKRFFSIFHSKWIEPWTYVVDLPKFVWNQKKYQKAKRLWRNWRLKNGQKFLGLFNEKIDSDSEISSLFNSSRVHFGQKFLGKFPKTSIDCNFFSVTYLFKSFWYFMHDQLFSTLELGN